MKKMIVTAALPYANGNIHLGHLVEYLQTDIWVRFHKMMGDECIYICADDTHGTPIMIKAKSLGITPEELIKKNGKAHLKDFTDFNIKFDNYYSTNSEENREISSEIFKAMEDKGHINVKTIKQSYCEHDKMFLPDRFLKGTCPKCKAVDQYGDSCEKCGATYSTSDILEPHCAVCNNTPILKESEHLFFKLNDFRPFLQEWVKKHTPGKVVNKLDEWLDEDLRDWDISRDAPYFGFEIPGHPGKYFYVWLDAPIGYIASTADWCKKNNRSLDEFWKDKDSGIYHFIGKDITYFHTLFWPAMLENAGYKTPDQVFIHGFLTVDGEKMSKSKGTFIKARTYLDHLDPLYLRYYYACKLNSSQDDIDLSFNDFISRVNSDLIGKITNLASRGAQMLGKRLDGKMSRPDKKGTELIKEAVAIGSTIQQHYQNREYNKVILEIRNIADNANKYFDELEPWKLIKENPEDVRTILTSILNIFRIIAIYLKPIIPSYAKKVEELFNEESYTWDSVNTILTDKNIGEYKHLLGRIDQKSIDKIIEESKENSNNIKGKTMSEEYEPIEPEINIDDLFKSDLRVAKIIEAEDIPEASKLLRLTVDIGIEKRNIIAGIKAAYKPEDLIGRYTVIVANLKPRKMKFGISEGMILAAGEGGEDLFILSPDKGVKAGQRIG